MGGPSRLASLTATSSRSLQRALKKPDTENKFPRGTSWLLRFLLRDAGSLAVLLPGALLALVSACSAFEVVPLSQVSEASSCCHRAAPALLGPQG